MNTIKIDKKQALMVAHRGVSKLEKENTIPAFVAAGNRSYYGIETDVHRTADGKYVVIHDSETARVAGDNIVIENSSLDLIRSVKLFDIDGVKGRIDLRIPTLEEYIKICKKYDKVCVLELKGSYTIEQVDEIVSIINEQDYMSNVIIISFSLQNLINFRVNHPTHPAQFLTGKFDDNLIENLTANNLDLDIYYASISEEQIALLKSKNIKINIWTCDDKEAAEKYVNWGVDFVTSNCLE